MGGFRVIWDRERFMSLCVLGECFRAVYPVFRLADGKYLRTGIPQP
jgi:hypothetical protein